MVVKKNLEVSISTDADTKAAENKQFEIEFKADYDEYRKRVVTYENNKQNLMHYIRTMCQGYEKQD